jgi:hypothetical protein
MALHKSLPVYKASYDLFLCGFKIIKDLNREYKYTAGEKIKNEVTDLMMNIYRANKIREKKEKIEKARENIEVTRLLFRLLKDLKQISLSQFVRVNTKIENVSKQLAGWQKSLN